MGTVTVSLLGSLDSNNNDLDLDLDLGMLKPNTLFYIDHRDTELDLYHKKYDPHCSILSKTTHFQTDWTRGFRYPPSEEAQGLFPGNEIDKVLQDILAPIRSQKLCYEFLFVKSWSLLNCDTYSNVSECMGSASSRTSYTSSAAGSTPVSTPGAASLSYVGKRKRDKDEDSFRDKNNGDIPSWIEDSSKVSRRVRFACPYRKHDPRRYTIHEARGVCALRFWDSVSRVKEHLFRSHLAPPYCPRCWHPFKFDDELIAHLTPSTNMCNIRPGKPPEGITRELEKALRRRKKSYPGQTEKERWEEVYRILFPNERVPSPYFEPVQEEAASSPTPQLKVLDNYAEYSRREMPRLFGDMLEGELRRFSRPVIEDVLIDRLPRIVEQCQDRILSNYVFQLRCDISPTPTVNNSLSTEATTTLPSNQNIISPGPIMLSPSLDSNTVSEPSELCYGPDQQQQCSSPSTLLNIFSDTAPSDILGLDFGTSFEEYINLSSAN